MAKSNRNKSSATRSKPAKAHIGAPADAPPRARGLDLLIPALVLLAAGLALGPVVNNPFVNWDDQEMILQNPGLNPPTAEKLLGFWTKPTLHLYTPLSYTAMGWLTLATQSADGSSADFVRFNPAAFHTLNLTLHLFSALWVYLLLRRLTGEAWAAGLGAMLFAVHPVQVEPVAWAASLNTVLSGMLSLAALWLYVEYAHANTTAHRRTWLWYGFATAAFLLALFAKPAAIVVPAMAAILDWALLHRPWRRIAVAIAPWLALSVVFAIIGASVQPAEGGDSPLWARPLIVADALAFYLGKLFWPAGLIPDYGRSPRWLLHRPELYWTWLVPAVLLAIAWVFRRRAPYLLGGLALLAASLVPVLGLVPFSFQGYSTVADRYLYLAMLAPALVLAFALARCPRAPSWRPALAGLAALAVVCVLAVFSRIQTGRWSDTVTLFNYTLEHNPRSRAAHRVLGFLLAGQGKTQQAIEHYRIALEVAPEDPKIHYNWGNLLYAQQRPQEALEHYRIAVQGEPDNVRMWNNLGIALAMLQEYDQATAACQRAVALDPTNAEAHTSLGLVLLAQGRYAEAADQFSTALNLDPHQDRARRGLSTAQQNLRDSPKDPGR